LFEVHETEYFERERLTLDKYQRSVDRAADALAAYAGLTEENKMNPIEPFWQEAVVSAIEGVVAVGVLGVAAEIVTRRAQRRREENQVKLDLVN
jgi:hypothetical protein